MCITRIWKGYKEFQKKPYHVGQELINGLYRDVTEEYVDRDMAEKMLREWEYENT